MGTPNHSDEPDRLTPDQELFVYSRHDIEEWAAEVHAQFRSHETVSDREAELMTDYAVALLTGDYLTDQ